MKKSTIKAFTLVEMLIVIVIIGILIASLMPRMQSAQGRARDVARKNDLAQIQTAIITSQQDRGQWPGGTGAYAQGLAVSGLKTDLTTAGMTQVPNDPNLSNIVYGLGGAYETGSYIYVVTTRNSVKRAGFALMAKTEVEGGSNWVVCGTGGTIPANRSLSKGWIKTGEDLKNITTCTSFQKSGGCIVTGGTCHYTDISELRYLLVY